MGGLPSSPFANPALVDEMLDWRISYAHNPLYADQLTSKPLAEAVCERSTFLMEGSTQNQMYKEIFIYLKPFAGVDGLPQTGPTMCCLSCFLWILTCWREYSRAALYFWTLFSNEDVPPYTSVEFTGGETYWSDGEVHRKSIRISLSRRHRVLLVFLNVLPRF